MRLTSLDRPAASPAAASLCSGGAPLDNILIADARTDTITPTSAPELPKSYVTFEASQATSRVAPRPNYTPAMATMYFTMPPQAPHQMLDISYAPQSYFYRPEANVGVDTGAHMGRLPASTLPQDVGQVAGMRISEISGVHASQAFPVTFPPQSSPPAAMVSGYDGEVPANITPSRSGPKSRKRRRSDTQTDGTSPAGDDDDEARKKARGRPRVDTKDETAADRRRTQIRMAQRAYRSRKESTISGLENEVQILKGVNEQMSSMLVQLLDRAAGEGLLQREPVFGQHFRSTAEKLLAIAKSTGSSETVNAESNLSDDTKSHSPSLGHTLKIEHAKGSTHISPIEPLQSIEISAAPSPPPQQSPEAWMDQPLSKLESPDCEPINSTLVTGALHRPNDIYTKFPVTAVNVDFPYAPSNLNLCAAEVAPFGISATECWLQQPSIPDTYAHTESSFGRRLQRAGLERAWKLIYAKHPNQDRFHEVFGFCLVYESRAEIASRIRRCMAATAQESLSEWRAPLVHVGGAGTYYPMEDPAGGMLPKHQTGQSMGPFPSHVASIFEVVDGRTHCTLPGFEGPFYDANDIAGYLRRRGLDIPPTADFVTREVDLTGLLEDQGSEASESNNSSSNFSIAEPITPNSTTSWPGAPIQFNHTAQSSSNMDYTMTMPIDQSAQVWDDFLKGAASNPLDISYAMTNTSAYSAASVPRSTSRYATKRHVTISVSFLQEEILKRLVCLGRSGGVRPSDVDAAIVAAVKAGV